MQNLSLNKAAKSAGVAKSTLLEAIKNGRLSAAKNEKGHWEIAPSELFRVFPKTGSTEHPKPIPTPYPKPPKTSEISALETEVKMLREQIELMDVERERERDHLKDQIETLKDQVKQQSEDHRQAIAILTDQRDQRQPQEIRFRWPWQK